MAAHRNDDHAHAGPQERGAEVGALHGLRVLDLATLYAAPLIATILADFGADVVKVEPPSGEAQRSVGAARDGKSLVWSFVARNKRCIALDLENAAGRSTLADLTAVADVVILNQPDRVLERWDCTAADIALRNPSAVIVRVSGFGSDGPNATMPANGTIAEAFGGLAHMTGDAGGPPLLASVPLGDTLAAMSGAIGLLAACHHRATTGGIGQVVDVALYEPIVSLLATSLAAWQEGSASPRRSGSRVAGGVPRNCYRCADGEHVVVSGPTDAQVDRVLELIGLVDEASRERFGRSSKRLRHADELDGAVASWIGERTADDVVAAFQAARVPVSRVMDVSSLVNDPHVRARGSIVQHRDAMLGDITMPAPQPRLSVTPGQVAWLGAEVGAHTDEVLASWIGLSPDAIAALRSSGAI